MKLSRKNVGRIATTFLATAMLASLTAVPAMAVDGDGTGESKESDGLWLEDELGENEIEISKVLKKRAEVAMPNVEFEVAISPEVPSIQEWVDGIPVQNGPVEAVSIDGTFKFSHTEDEDYGKTEVTSTGTVTIKFDTTEFDEPGIYKYILIDYPIYLESGENTQYAYEGMTCDTVYMYVYVEEDGYEANADGSQKMTYKVTNVVLTEETDPNNPETKVGNLTNLYGVDDDGTPDGTVNDLILTKKVEGNQGDTQKDWEFTITITPSNTETTEGYHYVRGTYNDGVWVPNTGEGSEGYFSVDGATGTASVTLTLKHGEYVRIYGLSENDKYTITENISESEGYDTSYTIWSTNPDKLDIVDPEYTAPEDGTEVKDQYVEASQTLTADYVEFTNDREASTPTGIVMNVAPYALLVVIAAAGCFVFLRKRDED